jgi:Helix-loop-helix DNA-binding domain
MAAVASCQPVADHIFLPGSQLEVSNPHLRAVHNQLLTLQDHEMIPSSFPWDQSPYGDLAPPSDLIDMFPGLPTSSPRSNSKYALPSQESDLDQTRALSFLHEDFGNSIVGWDDPTKSAHSLLVKSPSASPTSINLARISEELDDSVPFDDSLNDEPLLQSPQSLEETIDVPPRDDLYSTPLSWERPKLGCRVSSSMPYVLLSPEEEFRLRAIAMPARSSPITPPLSPSPEPVDIRKRKSRKRRSSESSESDCSPPPHSRCLGPQKIAHYMVEKRYRTNLNKKIAALRDSVPSLRVIDEGNSCSEDLQEDLQGLPLAKKLKKVIIHFHSLFYMIKFLHCFCTVANDLTPGNNPHQSSRIHRAPREAEQMPRGGNEIPKIAYECVLSTCKCHSPVSTRRLTARGDF